MEDRELAGVSTPDPLRRPLGVDEVVDLIDKRLLLELAALAALALSLCKSWEMAAGRATAGSSASTSVISASSFSSFSD